MPQGVVFGIRWLLHTEKKSEALRQQGASLCLVLQVVLFVHDMCVVGVGTGRNPCRHPLAGRPIDSPLFGFARVWVLRVAWTASTMRCTLTTVASAIVCVAAIVSTIPQQVLHDYGRGVATSTLKKPLLFF